MNKKEIEDGIICPEKFGKHPKSKHRILWILKESNDPDGGGWSLIDFLAKREEPKGLFSYEKWAATFGLVIKVSYGLLNGLIDYDRIEKLDIKKASEILDYIAIINIKKVPGGSRAFLAKVAEEINPQLILKQINEIKPDIVIGGNTLWILAKNNLFLESKELNKLSNDNWGLFKDKIFWVDAYHPNNMTVTHKEYYSQIIKLAKTILIKTSVQEAFNDPMIPSACSNLRTSLNMKGFKNIFVTYTKFQNNEYEEIVFDKVFETKEKLIFFLMNEKKIALATQELELAAQIQNLITNKSTYNQSLEFFYLKYFIRNTGDKSCRVLFETNLLSFKYNLIKEFTYRNKTNENA